MFQSARRPGEFQSYRAGAPERITSSTVSILVGAAMIAAAILLSTLITAVGTRYIGLESPGEDSMWLLDRLTGAVYKCQANARGKANCDMDGAAGSVGEQRKP